MGEMEVKQNELEMAGVTKGEMAVVGKCQGVSLEEAEGYIFSGLKSVVGNVITAGYYLKCIRDGQLYKEAGYGSIWEYAEDKFGLSVSTASRYMGCNDKYSVGGNSPAIDERYKDFNKSQMWEMLSLDNGQLEQVTPDMTVKQIRELKKPKEIPYIELPGQIEMLTAFPDISPEDVAASEQVREEMVQREAALGTSAGQGYTVSVQELLPDMAGITPLGFAGVPELGPISSPGIPQAIATSQQEPEVQESPEEGEPPSDVELLRNMLEREKGLLGSFLESSVGENNVHIREQKLLVQAIAAMLAEMEGKEI